MIEKRYYRDSLTGNTWKQEKDGWYLFNKKTKKYDCVSNVRPQNCVLTCFYVQHVSNKEETTPIDLILGQDYSKQKEYEPLTDSDKNIFTGKVEDNSKGRKYDGNKPLCGTMLNVFPRALFSIGAVIKKGKEKYPDPENWKKVEDGKNRYKDALMRHLLKWCMGISVDKESGLPHLTHVAWNALAILELYLMEHNEEVEKYTV